MWAGWYGVGGPREVFSDCPTAKQFRRFYFNPKVFMDCPEFNVSYCDQNSFNYFLVQSIRKLFTGHFKVNYKKLLNRSDVMIYGCLMR